MSCQALGWDFPGLAPNPPLGITGTVFTTSNGARWWLHYSYNNGPYSNMELSNQGGNIVIHSNDGSTHNLVIGITARQPLDQSNVSVSFDGALMYPLVGPYPFDPASKKWISSGECGVRSTSSSNFRVSSPAVKTVSKTILVVSFVVFLLLVLMALAYLFMRSSRR